MADGLSVPAWYTRIAGTRAHRGDMETAAAVGRLLCLPGGPGSSQTQPGGPEQCQQPGAWPEGLLWLHMGSVPAVQCLSAMGPRRPRQIMPAAKQCGQAGVHSMTLHVVAGSRPRGGSLPDLGTDVLCVCVWRVVGAGVCWVAVPVGGCPGRGPREQSGGQLAAVRSHTEETMVPFCLCFATTHKCTHPTWQLRLKWPGQNAGSGWVAVRSHTKAAAVTAVVIPQPPRT